MAHYDCLIIIYSCKNIQIIAIAGRNEKMKKNIEDSIDATECYIYEGTVELKGSKDSTTGSLSTIARCSYNGTWYLIKK